MGAYFQLEVDGDRIRYHYRCGSGSFVNCRDVAIGCSLKPYDGNFVFLDRQDVNCGTQFLTAMGLTSNGCDDSSWHYTYRCCEEALSPMALEVVILFGSLS